VIAGLTLPELSDADPEVAGEGSLDPLGLAALADRLADLLVPDVRARMSRIRFVTAVTVGAVVTEDLVDLPPADGESLASICFEWLVLESFVRKNRQTKALDATGIPGSSKASAVVLKGKRLDAANYLKTPRVFGFFGVYLPLARGLKFVDDLRLPAERWPQLTATWERENDLAGFTDGLASTEGGRFRRQLRDAVRDALLTRRCATAAGSHLFLSVARTLKPLGAGPNERSFLRSLLLSPEAPVRAETGSLLQSVDLASEPEALRAILPRASSDLATRIDAALAYERFAYLLDTGFRELGRMSTTLGSQPITPLNATGNEVLVAVARQIPDAYSRAVDAMADLDLALPLEQGLGRFGEQSGAAELVTTLMDHHERHQLSKPPRGKRPWFEEYGRGWVVRQPYRDGSTVTVDEDDVFIHPFRVDTLSQFLRDLSP
jgi:hypothetical protein